MNIKILARQSHGVCTFLMDLEYLHAYSNDCLIVLSMQVVVSVSCAKSPNDFARK